MPQQLFSVEQVANQLGLQVRTVRNYVRNGLLKATRIGKQYRIVRADLEAFTGLAQFPAREIISTYSHVEVSTVVLIDGISREGASRATNLLMGAAKGRTQSDSSLRLDTIYDEERDRLKIMQSGDAQSAIDVLNLVSALSGSQSDPKSDR